jgi:signal transduction histidine kinase
MQTTPNFTPGEIKALQDRLTKFEHLLEISNRMSETRAIEPLLSLAMAEALNVVNAERGCIVLIDEDGQLQIRGIVGEENFQEQISMSILKETVLTGKPIVIRDAIGDTKWGSETSIKQLQLRSVMCVPLIVRERVIGAVYVENRTIRGRFRDSDVVPLVFFGNQAAIAIENAALNERLEEHVAKRTAELQKANAHLESSWLQAVESNRIRTNILIIVTHDLRSPMNIILQILNFMREGQFGTVSGDQREWLNSALQSANHVIQLTNDIFDLTRIEVGHLSLVREQVELNAFIDALFNMGLGLPWQSEVVFKCEYMPDLPSVMVDPTRIRQVILNLLSNALKFTAQGSVTLHAHREADQVVIGVRDTGEGVPLEKRDLLFQRFPEIDTNPERRRMGTGLGLAVARELIEMHGGTIWMEDTPGGGSNFSFTLPLPRYQTD